MLITLLRVLALVLCFCGYFLMLRKAGLPMAFAPMVTVSAIGSILFLAGILNLLPHATVVLFLGGLFCLFRCRNVLTSKSDSLQLLGFWVLAALFCLRIAGRYPLHYDAFSHWMTVIHDILNNDRLPNFASELISFQGYPTGGAGFAYFLCKIIGLRSDDVILMTQALPVAAGLYVFVAFIKRFDLFSAALVLLGGLYCIVASPTENLSICEPLPDTLLSMLSIAGLAIIVHYRKEPAKALWWSLPLQIFLVAVKTSGVFMLIFNSLLLAWYVRQADPARSRKVCLKPLLIHCGIPFGVFFLWNRHVKLVFTYGTLSKHALSLDYYRGTLGAKSVRQVLDTLLLFLKRFFSPNPSWLLLFLCVILFGGIYLYRTKVLHKCAKDIPMVFGGLVAAYTVYMVGLAAMYVLSMTVAESAFLAGYDRYEETVVIYLVGAIVVYLLETAEDLPHAGVKTGCAAILGVIVLTQTARLPLLVLDTNVYEGSSRQLLEQAKESCGIPQGASCLIYGSPVEGDMGYHDGLGRYVFWSTEVSTCAPGADDFAEKAGRCEYLILLTSDETVDSYLTENGLTPGEAVYHLNPAQ